MPYKDPEVYREYMRAYRRKQRERKPTRKPNISETPIPKADPEHVRRLRQAEGGAVATPEGEGVYFTYLIITLSLSSPAQSSSFRVSRWGCGEQ